ncbi:radical SAM protein [bacterium]|nr:radical SAM protein [candidate division CSSED10-310 bacterium]
MKLETRAVVDWMSDGIPRPARIEAEITAHCNLNCRFCWIQDPPAFRRANLDKEMRVERWLRLTEETAELGTEIWRIGGGGEPMVRPRVTVPVMLSVKRLGMKGHLTTNGTIFSEPDAAAVVESGWDVIEFSIDGPDAGLHDELRGTAGAFARTMTVIDRFNTCKDAAGSDTPQLLISSVLVRDNLDHMMEMMRLAADKRIRKVSINPMTVMVRDEQKKRIVWGMKVAEDIARQRDEQLAKAKEEADRLGIDTNVHHFIANPFIERTNDMDSLLAGAAPAQPPGILAIPCYSPWYLASIRPHGTMGACCRFRDGEAENLVRQSFRDIWHGPVFTAVRRELMEMGIPEYCAGCSPNNIRFEGEIREELRAYLGNRS